MPSHQCELIRSSFNHYFSFNEEPHTVTGTDCLPRRVSWFGDGGWRGLGGGGYRGVCGVLEGHGQVGVCVCVCVLETEN